MNLGGPIGKGAGEWAECGRASFGGEDAKYSSVDIKGREGAVWPLANLNGGQSIRADFDEVDVVVKPLVRDNEGLIKEDLLRLAQCQNDAAHFPQVQIQEMLTLKVLAVSVAPVESPASHLHSRTI